MSQKKWNVYCHNLMADEKISGCLITSFDGTIWGNKELYSTPAELKQIIDGFSPQGCEKLRQNGIKIMGDKYWLTSCDDQVIRGTRGGYGFSAYKANSCILIGKWDANTSAGMATNRIENMGSYIKANKF